MRERCCFSKLCFAIPGCVTHSQSWVGKLQQAGFGSWGITSSVRSGCWPVGTSVWADAKLLALVPLLWLLGKVWVKIPAFFVAICNCSSTFYISVCQCFTINSLYFPGIWLGCKNSLLANLWHSKSGLISNHIPREFNHSPAPYSNKMVLQWRRLVDVSSCIYTEFLLYTSFAEANYTKLEFTLHYRF